MIELIINGQKADVEQKAFTYTLQVNDMFNFDTREVSYSDTIYIPITFGNRSIFGFADVSMAYENGAYVQYKVDYFVNGIPIVQGGIGALTGVRGDYFIFEFKENSKKLYQFLQNRDIKGLQGLVGYVDRTGIFVENSNQGIAKTMFLLADYGDDSANRGGNGNIYWDIKKAPLSINLKHVFDLVAKNGGFKFDGNFLNDSFFKEVYICSSNIKYENDIKGLIFTSKSYITNVFSKSFINQSFGFGGVTGEKDSAGNDIYSLGVSSVQAGYHFYPPYSFRKGGQYRLTISIKKIIGKERGVGRVNVQLLNSLLGENYVEVYAGHTWNDIVFTYDFYANRGDTLYLKFWTDNTYNLCTTEGVEIKIEERETNLNLKELVSDLSLVDLFKNIFNLFSITPMYDRKNDSFHFYTLSERVNTHNILYWSEKFVRIKELKFHSSNYAKKNNFVYKKYDDNKGYLQDNWDGVMNFNDETLVDRKDNQVGFYAPFNKRISIDLEALEHIEYFEKEEKLDNGQLKIEYKEKEGRWHIFSRHIINKEVLVKGFTEGYYRVGKIYGANAEPLKWENLLNKFYKDLPRIMEHPYIVTAEFALSEIDIYEFSFFSKIYVEQLGSVFLPNRIKYKAGALAEVEMIKIS